MGVSTRRTRRIVVGILTATVLGASGVAAQKGKTTTTPNYIWSASISQVDASGGQTNVYGPSKWLSEGDGHVSVEYYRQYEYPFTRFGVYVDAGLSDGWIGFRGITPIANRLYFDTLRNQYRPQACRFSNTFDANAFPRWEGPYGETLPDFSNPADTRSCVTNFLSGADPTSVVGHRFPTASWRRVMVDFRADFVNFDTMSVGQTITAPSGNLIITVIGPSGCPTSSTETYYSHIAQGPVDVAYGLITVTRTDANTWVTDSTLNVGLYESVPGPGVVSRKGVLTCPGGTLAQLTTTAPVNARVTWKRTLVR